MCVALVAGCASSRGGFSSDGTDPAGTPTTIDSVVSITTFAMDAERVHLDAIQDGVRFEARDGCLYAGDYQTLWFFGTTLRPKAGSKEFEVIDPEGRKLAETGTTIRWGGGQVSATEAATYNFVEKLAISPTCAAKGDTFWLVGAIKEAAVP